MIPARPLVSDPSFLSFYRLPPTGEVTLDQFEGAALDRLSILQSLEDLFSKKNGKDRAIEHITKLFPLSCEDDVRRDTISHYSMRLAFARPKDRSWLLKQETALFKLRLEHLIDTGSNHLSSFLRSNRIPFTRLEEKEFHPSRKDLSVLLPGRELHTSDFFKVRFEESLELVRDRSVLLRNGFAYLHKTQLIFIVCGRFRTILSEGLSQTFTSMPEIDERVSPLLSSLARRTSSVDYRSINATPSDRVLQSDLDSLSKTHFPLCMSSIHSHLRIHHHLKHGARFQYGLFLKGIGLSLDDALEFWRKEFTRIMDSKTFESSHSYNIRHIYGKEGKGSNYLPMSCNKIISRRPGPEDHHGCPFREEKNLSEKLSSLDEKTASIILKLSNSGHYQSACSKYFEATHGEGGSVVVNHPNQYYKMSSSKSMDKK